MSKLAFLSSGAGVTAAGATAVVGVVALIAYGSGVFEPAPQDLPEAQAAPVEQTLAAPAAPSVEVETAETVETAGPVAPSFDVVRVEVDGAAMIAGRAEAGSTVAIRLDETVVAEVKADSSGKFAGFVSLPQSEDAKVLTLDSESGGASEQQVIVAPIEPETPLETHRVTQTVPQPDPGEAVRAEEPQAAPQVPAKGESTPQAEKKAPTVMLATKEGVRVLQAPDARAPKVTTSLLGAISYDDTGEVALTGNAGGEFVRVYLDNRPVAVSQIAANGDWSAGLPEVDTGIYTLRVDEINRAGDVVGRVETPFKRETPDVLAAASVPEKPLQLITVQPGATLWAIARARYGSGMLYARVLEANADMIKDPDLIYPGQVFTVPD